MENVKNQEQDRVLARVTASDLVEVIGGLEGGTCEITGPAQGNINGSDITNTGGDGDAY